jgi:hypothetical protein
MTELRIHMAEPKDMTEAELRQELRTAILARREALGTEVDARTTAAIDAALAPIIDALMKLNGASVQYGQAVCLKADGGQFLSAEGGGPTAEKQIWVLGQIAPGHPPLVDRIIWVAVVLIVVLALLRAFGLADVAVPHL